MADQVPDPSKVPFLASVKPMLMSFLNSLLALVLFALAVSALPAVQDAVDIPASWIVYATAALAVLRTAVAYLNPKDPSFGIGS